MMGSLLDGIVRNVMKSLLTAVGMTLASAILLGGLVFIAAGRWNLPLVWAYLGGYMALGLVSILLLARRSPDLLAQRTRLRPSDVPDQLFRWALALGFLAHFAVAGVDVGRFHWSGALPLPVQMVGLLGVLAAIGLGTWAAASNPFFTPEVRMQQERGQYVVTAGPYQLVRHPGYTSAILFMLLSGVALGSWWSILPMLLVIALLIRRTALEDRLLQQNLPGYTDYARTVRFRLVPGVW
jgi:protein-S-isoprenylcysteine O-methyltransferase Ste14